MSDSTPTIVIHGPSVRWAAESLRRAGHRVVGIDRFGDSDALAACAEFHIATPSDCPASLASTTAAKWNAPVIRVGGDPNADGWPVEQAQQIRELAGQASIPVPESSDHPPVDGRHRWLRKRRRSTGGLGVQRHARAHRIESSGDGSAHGFVWQREIAGRPHGLVALATEDNVELIGLCRGMNTVLHRNALEGRRPFVYAGSIGPCSQRGLPWERWLNFARHAADALKLRGLFNIDFVRDGDGRFWFLEINARPSGSCEVLERSFIRQGILAANDSLMRWHLAALHQDLAPTQLFRYSASGEAITCKRIVYANQDGHWDPTGLPVGTPVEEVAGRIQVADVGVPGTFVRQGDPVATILIDVNRTLAVNDAAEQRRTCRRWIGRVRAAVKPAS